MLITSQWSVYQSTALCDFKSIQFPLSIVLQSRWGRAVGRARHFPIPALDSNGQEGTAWYVCVLCPCATCMRMTL